MGEHWIVAAGTATLTLSVPSPIGWPLPKIRNRYAAQGKSVDFKDGLKAVGRVSALKRTLLASAYRRASLAALCDEAGRA